MISRENLNQVSKKGIDFIRDSDFRNQIAGRISSLHEIKYRRIKGMNKIEEVSFLKGLEGKTGKYADSQIVVGFRGFTITGQNQNMLTAEFYMNPRGISNEKKTVKVLKDVLEGSHITSDIENTIVATTEKAIKNKISDLQKELREIIGLNKIKDICEDNPEEGGTIDESVKY